MGGPKALLGPLSDGRSPLARVSEWLHEGGCDQVIAVIGASAEEVRHTLPEESWLLIVEASDWNEGMGASLRAGLSAAKASDADAAVITLVDLPDVGTSVFRRLLDLAPASRDALARASFKGVPGHPVLIGRDWWGQVLRVAHGDQGARKLFASTPHQLVDCSDLASGMDADTPERL